MSHVFLVTWTANQAQGTADEEDAQRTYTNHLLSTGIKGSVLSGNIQVSVLKRKTDAEHPHLKML